MDIKISDIEIIEAINEASRKAAIEFKIEYRKYERQSSFFVDGKEAYYKLKYIEKDKDWEKSVVGIGFDLSSSIVLENFKKRLFQKYTQIINLDHEIFKYKKDIEEDAMPFIVRLFLCRMIEDKIACIHASNVMDNKTDKLKIPESLKTEEVENLFNKIIDLNYCIKDGDLYKWIGTSALFGYFVDRVSGELEIRPSNDRLPWKMFKAIFQCDEKMVKTAKQIVNDYKNKGLSKPNGYKEIDKLCR